jgi:aryl-alcohol dehydrogenase-like predicted oxidoreductase
MRRALDHGVNWIDTAAVYGLGHSEEVVGRVLEEIPGGERPFVFTKCGLIWDPERPMVVSARVLRPDSIRAECEASLRRLGVERIDLYQFHWPDESGVPIEDSWAEMARLVEAGKVRLAGLSNFTTPLLDRCEAIRHVDSLQSPYSLIRRGIADREIPWCREHGTGVLCYSPMQSGILTDRFSKARVDSLAPDDWRRKSPEFAEPKLSMNIALRDALRSIAERHKTAVSVIAVAWTLSTPGVTAAIVGARSAQQVDGWIDAGRITLTPEDLAEIAAAVERTQ